MIQPFDTAPRDGSSFLAGRHEDGGWKWFAIGRWFPPAQYYVNGGFGFARDNRPDPYFNGATHWMPLPAVEAAA